MNDIRIFSNTEFGQIRTINIGDEVYFVGKDIAEILGYSNTRKAIIDHVDTEDKKDGVTIRDSIGREQNPTLINESGLYSLILSSKLPNAKKFKRWVTSEVLPQIRKTGVYAMPNTSKELRAILMVDNKTEELKNEFNDFKDNAPLFNIECERLTKAVKKKVIKLIGMKTPAYNDKSIRGKVFSDLQRQIKREFDVDSYKAIKRVDFNMAIEIIEEYTLPMALSETVKNLNAAVMS